MDVFKLRRVYKHVDNLWYEDICLGKRNAKRWFNEVQLNANKKDSLCHFSYHQVYFDNNGISIVGFDYQRDYFWCGVMEELGYMIEGRCGKELFILDKDGNEVAVFTDYHKALLWINENQF